MRKPLTPPHTRGVMEEKVWKGEQGRFFLFFCVLFLIVVFRFSFCEKINRKQPQLLIDLLKMIHSIQPLQKKS